MLTEKERQKITKILQKQNKYLWTLTNIENVLYNLSQLRSGIFKKTDWFCEGILTVEEYFLQLNLTEFL